MKKSRGYIVSWFAKDGSKKRGIVYYAEQVPEFQKFEKVLIHEVDEKLQPSLDDKGKKIINLKHKSLIQVIGFVD